MSDSAFTYLFLCGTALVAGVINSVAGGGTLLTFPALLHALSGNGVLANGTSTVAVVPGSVAGAWGYRRELSDKRTVLHAPALAELVGGAVGALLVTRFPDKVFQCTGAMADSHSGPAVSSAATGAALDRQPQARRAADEPYGRHTRDLSVCRRGLRRLFWRGHRYPDLSALAFMNVGDIHHMNGVKSFLAAMITAWRLWCSWRKGRSPGSTRCQWPPRQSRADTLGRASPARLPAIYVRWMVIAIGFGLSTYYFWQQFK